MDFNKIKKISVALSVVIAIIAGFSTCQKDETRTDSQIAYSKAYAIAYKYMFVEDNQFVLKLSEKEALSLGINKLEFNKIQMEINQANAFLMERIAAGDKFMLIDPKSITCPVVRLKSGDNEHPPIVNDPCCGKFKYECTCSNGNGGFCTCETVLPYNPCGSGGFTCTGWMMPPCQ